MPRGCSIVLLFAALLLVRAVPAAAAPLGHGFTYQGQLQQSGVPVDGDVTLRFSLWNTAGDGGPPASGTAVGGAQIVANVPVRGGVFSVVLNGNGEFGPDAFSGDERWLQVEVCSDSTCSATTVLGPRQSLTGTPYALGPWQLNGTSLNYTGGKVGIGTTAPAHTLHLKDHAPAIILEDTAGSLLQSGYLAFWNGASETGWMGYGTAGSPDMTFANARPAGDIAFWAAGEKVRIENNGNVGIGTSTPASKLEVRGDVRLGSVGELFATGSGENLRIVRGEVLAAGSISAGSGFTVQHPATGIYNIVFTTPFLATSHPAFSITPVANSGTLIAMASSLPGPVLVAVRIVNGSGTATDGAFSFTVIGAR